MHWLYVFQSSNELITNPAIIRQFIVPIGSRLSIYVNRGDDVDGRGDDSEMVSRGEWRFNDGCGRRVNGNTNEKDPNLRNYEEINIFWKKWQEELVVKGLIALCFEY
jgi:hypothetical protein